MDRRIKQREYKFQIFSVELSGFDVSPPNRLSYYSNILIYNKCRFGIDAIGEQVLFTAGVPAAAA